jgi:6-phosphogluconolactonase (cycloisomerase 2 family)
VRAAFWVASRDGALTHLEVRGGRLHRRGRDIVLGGDLAAVAAHPSGRLVASVPTEPRPRGLDLDRSGRWLLVSGELADTVTLYDATAPDLPVLDRCPVARGAVWVQRA